MTLAMDHGDMMEAVGAAAKIDWLRRGKSSPTTLRLHRPRSETNTKKSKSGTARLFRLNPGSEQRAASLSFFCDGISWASFSCRFSFGGPAAEWFHFVILWR